MARRPALTKKKGSASGPTPQLPPPAIPPGPASDPLDLDEQARLLDPDGRLGLPWGSAIDKPVDQPERGPATFTAGDPPRVSVTVDTYVLRPDLGPNTKTFVAKGDLVPLGLEGFTRVPA